MKKISFLNIKDTNGPMVKILKISNNELIIRPDFKLFIDFLKSNYKNAEIFIYLNDAIISIYPEI